MKYQVGRVAAIAVAGWLAGCGLTNGLLPAEKGSCSLFSDGGQSLPVCFDYATAQSPILGNSFSCGFTLFADAGTTTYSTQSCPTLNRVGSCSISEFSTSEGVSSSPGVVRYYEPLITAQAMTACVAGTTAVFASNGSGGYALVDAGGFYLVDGGTFTPN